MDLTDADDETVMRAVSFNDTEAFEELVRRFQVRLFRFSLRRVQDRQIAEDVVQETLLKVWRHRGGFRQDARLSTWVFAMCLNLVRDHWRRLKPEQSLELPEVALAAEYSRLRARPKDASERAEQGELAGLLMDALENLGGRGAELLLRRGYDDLTLEDAGKQVGLGPEAARATASRAYKKLKIYLSKRMD